MHLLAEECTPQFGTKQLGLNHWGLDISFKHDRVW